MIPRAPHDQAIVAAIFRLDFGTFIAKVFRTVSPGDAYIHNWHIDAIAYALMTLHRGENRRLIVTQPPRSLKSICVSVAYVAWALGHDPSMKFACVSYSQELAAVFARQFRAVVTSEWYRALFPAMRLAKETETECETSRGGGRFAVSVGGSFTGRGADVIIIDDPMKASDAQSEGARRLVNDWFGTTLQSRLDDKVLGIIMLVMQRLHEDDLAGKLLRDGGWRLLNLPAIAEEDQEIPIGAGVVHHFRKGDVLHPEREPLIELERLRREMGALQFSAQYLQQPVPIDGNLVRLGWIKWFDERPNRVAGVRIIQSYDVASTTGERNDWSVCTTWQVIGRNHYLIDVWRGRLEFPSLKRQLVDLARAWSPHSILVEQAGPGLNLIQEFRANPVPGVPTPIGVKPEGEKIERMAAQSARFEAGQVHFPKEAPWLAALLTELMGFPKARHDDQVDSISQFLNWIESRRMSAPTVSIFGPIIIRG